MQTPTISTAIQIQKPAREVFNAIVNPDQMSNYFISESSGKMESGKTITWRFPEFDMDVPVKAEEIREPGFISFSWDHENRSHLVEMRLETQSDNSTLVKITEQTDSENPAGILWVQQNTEGWANFLACLKAWLEYGINLRKGAFDFMRNPKE